MTKEYAYRRWQVLLGGTVAVVFGAGFLFPLLMSVVFKTDWHGFTIWKILFLLCVIVIPGLMLTAGLWLMHAWMTRRVNRLEVSDIGVRYGSQFRTWEEIRWFSYHYVEKKRPILFYQRKGFFAHDFNLDTTDLLSEDEISELFKKLREEVAPLNHELKIG